MGHTVGRGVVCVGLSRGQAGVSAAARTYARAVAQILVVEDDDRIAKSLVGGLQMSGHAVVRAATGAQALAD